MKDINVTILANRTKYDMTSDLLEIKKWFGGNRGVSLNFRPTVKTDISGYRTIEQKNSFGNYQYVLTGADELVRPYLHADDNICILVIQGAKEFGQQCPSECVEKTYIPGTKTALITVNADDQFSDQKPNFYIWLSHAIKHALFTIANYDGYALEDCMDVLTGINGQPLYYFRNYEPDNVNSNHINAMERLYPWIFNLPKKKS